MGSSKEDTKNTMPPKIKYHFSNKLWKYKSPGGWYFVSVPKELSKEIRDNLQWQEEGWGRMKASIVIKDQQWDTSIWFDTKMDIYILPIKSDIRKKLALKEGDSLTVDLSV